MCETEGASCWKWLFAFSLEEDGLEAGWQEGKDLFSLTSAFLVMELEHCEQQGADL